MCLYRNMEERSRNHCRRGRATSITYSERVSVALVIVYGKRMRRVILSRVACLALQYIFFLPNYLINGTIFEKKILLNIKCVQILSMPLSETLIIQKRNEHYHK
jgi:hypothetical protein